MRAFVIFATVLAVALARPQGEEFGGYASAGSFSSGGGGGGGSDELQRGESQVIDLSEAFGAGGAGGRSDAGGAGGAGGSYDITKAFYLHEAPEEEARADSQQQAVKNKKHYKIIFVKAPSEGGAAGGAAAIPTHEEKTIVYVLSKKNGAAGGAAADVPTPVTHKPDVFFVKYKNAADSEQVVAKIQESFKEGGEGYNSPAAFAKSLGASGSTGGASASAGFGAEYERRRRLRYRIKK